MPVTAEQALQMINSLEMSENEKKWFDRLCEYTDIYITNHFDGHNIRIRFENMFYKNTNYGWQPYSIPCWRQVSIVKVWLSTYEKIGWKITPSGEKWSCNPKVYRYSEYLFEPDLRDMRIDKILQ